MYHNKLFLVIFAFVSFNFLNVYASDMQTASSAVVAGAGAVVSGGVQVQNSDEPEVDDLNGTVTICNDDDALVQLYNHLTDVPSVVNYADSECFLPKIKKHLNATKKALKDAVLQHEADKRNAIEAQQAEISAMMMAGLQNTLGQETRFLRKYGDLRSQYDELFEQCCSAQEQVAVQRDAFEHSTQQLTSELAVAECQAAQLRQQLDQAQAKIHNAAERILRVDQFEQNELLQAEVSNRIVEQSLEECCRGQIKRTYQHDTRRLCQQACALTPRQTMLHEQRVDREILGAIEAYSRALMIKEEAIDRKQLKHQQLSASEEVDASQAGGGARSGAVRFLLPFWWGEGVYPTDEEFRQWQNDPSLCQDDEAKEFFDETLAGDPDYVKNKDDIFTQSSRNVLQSLLNLHNPIYYRDVYVCRNFLNGSRVIVVDGRIIVIGKGSFNQTGEKYTQLYDLTKRIDMANQVKSHRKAIQQLTSQYRNLIKYRAKLRKDCNTDASAEVYYNSQQPVERQPVWFLANAETNALQAGDGALSSQAPVASELVALQNQLTASQAEVSRLRSTLVIENKARQLIAGSSMRDSDDSKVLQAANIELQTRLQEAVAAKDELRAKFQEVVAAQSPDKVIEPTSNLTIPVVTVGLAASVVSVICTWLFLRK